MSCVRSVRTALLGLDSSDQVAIDFSAKVAYVVPDGAFDAEAAIAALAEKGYDAELR